MKVKNCINCPFMIKDFDPDCMGYDTLLDCNLAIFQRKKEHIIVSYDSWPEEDIKIETPDWCPLKEQDFTIQLE